jgi:hypothetical protein
VRLTRYGASNRTISGMGTFLGLDEAHQHRAKCLAS